MAWELVRGHDLGKHATAMLEHKWPQAPNETDNSSVPNDVQHRGATARMMNKFAVVTTGWIEEWRASWSAACFCPELHRARLPSSQDSSHFFRWNICPVSHGLASWGYNWQSFCRIEPSSTNTWPEQLSLPSPVIQVCIFLFTACQSLQQMISYKLQITIWPCCPSTQNE